jgi:uncharacterized phage protein gp47/JayE
MPYPVPAPAALADAQSAELEEALALAPDGSARVVDARSPRSVLGAIARTNALQIYGVHTHLAWIARQMFPDTAEAEFLERHASIWGVARRAAIAAVGQVTLTGAVGLSVPSAITFTSGSATYVSTAGGTMPGGGTLTVPVTASSAGAGANVPAGTKLALVSPLLGLSAQQGVVATGGITGGADIEDDDSLRERVLAEIREPAHGGAFFDYERWAQEAIAPARVLVRNAWVGAGSVGVIFCMANGDGTLRAPTSTEITVLDTYLQGVAPVTAEVVTVGATPTALNVAVAVNPDTAATRDAVTAAIQAFFKGADAAIGGVIRRSRLSEAISAAVGETWHSLTAPAADTAFTDTQVPQLGTLTVTGAA